MPPLVVAQDVDGDWSVRLDGVEVRTVPSRFGVWNVLLSAQEFAADELVTWLLHDDGGFLAVIDADREPSGGPGEHYLGDGVYAGFNDGLLTLTAGPASVLNKIAMDPKVLANLIAYATTVRAQPRTEGK